MRHLSPSCHWRNVESRVAAGLGRVALAFLIVSALVFQQACTSEREKAIAKSQDLAAQLTQSAPEIPAEITATEKHVYIDHSESMAGFVRPNISATPTTFDEFIDALPGFLVGCQVFKYGQRPRSQQAQTLEEIRQRGDFDYSLHDRQQYRMLYNPDDILIRGLVDQQPSTLSLVVTDGVESAADGKVNTVVVSAIRDWLNQGKPLGIFIFKSVFSGKVFSAGGNTFIGETTAARPFYAFVFSPNLRDIQDLQEKLENKFGDKFIRAIVFSDRSITGNIEMPLEINASYMNEQPANKPYYWHMLIMKDLNPETGEEFNYKFNYKIQPDYPIKLLGLRLNVKLHRWEHEKDQFQSEGIQLPISIEFGPVAEAAAAQIQSMNLPSQSEKVIRSQQFLIRPTWLIGVDSQSSYSFFCIDPFPYVKELDGIIEELTTSDDRILANAGKTYRFRELIYAILDAHLKERLAPLLSQKLYITGEN
jgi:hypothetical protein